MDNKLVITYLCKITSADEEEGQDGEAATAKRAGASVRRAGAAGKGFTWWSPAPRAASWRGWPGVPAHGAASPPDTPPSSSLRLPKSPNHLRPASKQPRGRSTHTGWREVHVLLMDVRLHGHTSTTASPTAVLSYFCRSPLPGSLAGGKDASGQTTAADTWLRTETATQAMATFLISKNMQAGLYLRTLYVYSLIYNLIKLYGPRIRNPH